MERARAGRDRSFSAHGRKVAGPNVSLRLIIHRLNLPSYRRRGGICELRDVRDDGFLESQLPPSLRLTFVRSCRLTADPAFSPSSELNWVIVSLRLIRKTAHMPTSMCQFWAAGEGVDGRHPMILMLETHSAKIGVPTRSFSISIGAAGLLTTHGLPTKANDGFDSLPR